MQEEKARVQKWIAESGFCGRRKAESYIDEGKVTVNGKKVSLGDHCLPDDTIKVDGKALPKINKRRIYIIINKPEGVVTTKQDERQRKTVLDLLQNQHRYNNLFPAGRLDMNTTGLLILTNDGTFTQTILHPSHNTTKTYKVNLDKPLINYDWEDLEQGITIDDTRLAPCKINKRNPKTYQVILQEGRKRQIRKMFSALGYEVIHLERTHIGKLALSKLNLMEGQYRIVSKAFLERCIHGD
jgi:23S rRNA pseudouridine2605 synthase